MRRLPRIAAFAPLTLLACGENTKSAVEPATPPPATAQVVDIPAPAQTQAPTPSAAASATPPPAETPAEEDAKGTMWGDAIGDSFGAGGLGLQGVGEGGGGRGEGIGIGSTGTLGHGAGTGTSQGFGSGHGRLGGGSSGRTPSLRQGATQVNGRLPPEVIQRIVRQNFGRFRLCYEQGLRTKADLQGRVAVRFTIDRTGAVSKSENGGSDMPDPKVVDCVVRAFNGMSFPQPEGGVVVVVYPIIFDPGQPTTPPATSGSAAPKPPTGKPK